MSTFSELWPTVTGTDVIVWAAMDPRDTARRIALYKNRAGITGRMNGKQLEALGYTLAQLPVIKTAETVAAALRAGYPANFNWNYFDFILSSAGSSGAAVDMSEVMSQVNATLDTRLSSVFVYKGSVEGLDDLPMSDNTQGDVYQVQDDSYAEYVWVEGDPAHWEYLGKTVDLSNYSTTPVMNAAIEVARLDAKRVYSSTDLVIIGETTREWFECLATKVSGNLMSTNSLVIGSIVVSDLPDDLSNAEIMVRVIAGLRVCYYATIFSDTGVMYQLNTSGSDYVWEKIAFNSYLTTHIEDGTKHITASERDAWNAKAAGDHTHEASEITAPFSTNVANWIHSVRDMYIRHDVIADSNGSEITTEQAQHFDAMHVVGYDRVNWNEAHTHISDANPHVTAEQKAAWTAKQDAIPAGTYATPADVAASAMHKVFIHETASFGLSTNLWYICSAALTGILPASPADGSEIKISVVTGGEATEITSSSPDTVNGSTDALAINIANDTVTLVYDATLSNWLVL